MGRYGVVTYADTCFLQIFLWEIFGGIAPRPVEFEKVTMVEEVLRGKRKKRMSHPYMPRGWR